MWRMIQTSHKGIHKGRQNGAAAEDDQHREQQQNDNQGDQPPFFFLLQKKKKFFAELPHSLAEFTGAFGLWQRQRRESFSFSTGSILLKSRRAAPQTPSKSSRQKE
jgi:hypothetical protein